MDDRSAWKNLGADPDKIFKAISDGKGFEKINIAQELLELAKKKAKKLLIENHPDRGGSSEKFTMIQRSIEQIEKSTDSFVKRLKFKLVSDQASAKRKK